MPDLNFCENVEHWLAREPGTIVLQPTSLCPLACTYCYLPERHLKREMSPVTACAIASGIPLGWSSSGPVEIVWHGGEPLAIGWEIFVELLESFELLRLAGRVQHKVQTGAPLITGEWCDIFERYGMGVGVSIDGPRSANRHRLNRGGRPTFDRVIAGIDALVNIDGKVPTIDQARRFWRDTFTWSRNNPGMKVREFEYLLGFLGLDSAVRDADARHDLIPTIGWNGDVILLSPELLESVTPTTTTSSPVMCLPIRCQ
jgi:uncharacterized protein